MQFHGSIVSTQIVASRVWKRIPIPLLSIAIGYGTITPFNRWWHKMIVSLTEKRRNRFRFDDRSFETTGERENDSRNIELGTVFLRNRLEIIINRGYGGCIRVFDHLTGIIFENHSSFLLSINIWRHFTNPSTRNIIRYTCHPLSLPLSLSNFTSTIRSFAIKSTKLVELSSTECKSNN